MDEKLNTLPEETAAEEAPAAAPAPETTAQPAEAPAPELPAETDTAAEDTAAEDTAAEETAEAPAAEAAKPARRKLNLRIGRNQIIGLLATVVVIVLCIALFGYGKPRLEGTWKVTDIKADGLDADVKAMLLANPALIVLDDMYMEIQDQGEITVFSYSTNKGKLTPTGGNAVDYALKGDTLTITTPQQTLTLTRVDDKPQFAKAQLMGVWQATNTQETWGEANLQVTFSFDDLHMSQQMTFGGETKAITEAYSVKNGAFIPDRKPFTVDGDMLTIASDNVSITAKRLERPLVPVPTVWSTAAIEHAALTNLTDMLDEIDRLKPTLLLDGKHYRFTLISPYSTNHQQVDEGDVDEDNRLTSQQISLAYDADPDYYSYQLDGDTLRLHYGASVYTMTKVPVQPIAVSLKPVLCGTWTLTTCELDPEDTSALGKLALYRNMGAGVEFAFDGGFTVTETITYRGQAQTLELRYSMDGDTMTIGNDTMRFTLDGVMLTLRKQGTRLTLIHK